MRESQKEAPCVAVAVDGCEGRQGEGEETRQEVLAHGEGFELVQLVPLPLIKVETGMVNLRPGCDCYQTSRLVETVCFDLIKKLVELLYPRYRELVILLIHYQIV